MTSIVNSGTDNFIADTSCVQAGTFTGPGYVPPGTIIPVMTHVGGSFSISSGQVVRGWMLANGQGIPGGNTLSGTTPNLSDARFVLGNTSAGGGGGSNSVTLSVANMASHSHSVPIHNHSSGVGFSTDTSSSCSHTHGVSQSYTTSGGCNTPMLFHNQGGALSSFCRQPGWAGPWNSYTDTNWQISYHSHSWSISGSLSGNMSHAHSLGQSGGVCNYTSSTSACGSATAITNLPPYMTTVYLIRVK